MNLFGNQVHTKYNSFILSRLNEISILSKCKLSSKSQKLREEFSALEQKYENKIQDINLSPEDYKIYMTHKNAILKRHFTYDDPNTGYKVFTRLRHFLKESCCGNACRHCIYDHENVPSPVKSKRIFNGAFWKDRPSATGDQLHIRQPPVLKNEEDQLVENNDPELFNH